MRSAGIIGSDDQCPPHLKPGQCKKGDYITREVWGKVGGLTHTEQRTHFAFWCALAAPLMLGNDPRRMSAATRRILMAPQLLAINQDPLGQQARRVWREGTLAIWRKELASGEDALLLFNGGEATADITVVWMRDVSDSARGHEAPVPPEAPCVDKAAQPADKLGLDPTLLRRPWPWPEVLARGPRGRARYVALQIASSGAWEPGHLWWCHQPRLG